LNENAPPFDVTCCGTPDAVVLQVEGVGDGDGEGEGDVGEDGVSLLFPPHAAIRNSTTKGASRPKADRFITADLMHEVGQPSRRTMHHLQISESQALVVASRGAHAAQEDVTPSERVNRFLTFSAKLRQFCTSKHKSEGAYFVPGARFEGAGR
jgi:hypothetical protein